MEKQKIVGCTRKHWVRKVIPVTAARAPLTLNNITYTLKNCACSVNPFKEWFNGILPYQLILIELVGYTPQKHP